MRKGSKDKMYSAMTDKGMPKAKPMPMAKKQPTKMKKMKK